MPAIPTGLQRINYNGELGSIQTGRHTQVINEAVSARTLIAREAGATCCFDLAAGVVYTLPAPVAGMEFEFFSTVTITSNSAKIITNAASVFLLGEVFTYTTATASGAGFAFNGSTHIACLMNGTTSGGIIGTKIRVKALSATQWLIDGLIVGSGTIVTPASTT
jgi:hypothetical protein